VRHLAATLDKETLILRANVFHFMTLEARVRSDVKISWILNQKVKGPKL